MREIKFRALLRDATHVWWEYYMTLTEPSWIDVKDWDIIEKDLQFTGLLDKNGKEIYEGDIMKLQYPINYGFAGIHDKEIIVSISFESGSFWFTGNGYTDCNWHFYNEYEVIGNIYENPELLQ